MDERLWNTDFNDLLVDNKIMPSVEDKRALHMMVLPWRQDPPVILNDKPMAERRFRSLKNRLENCCELLEKYTNTMQDYINKGYAEKVPKEELEKDEGTVWYFPHHPVTHCLKPNEVRIAFACVAKFRGVSLNQ